MDFTTLIASLKTGDTEKALEIAEALQPKFETTIEELKTYDGKLSDAVSTRDKAKEKIKALAGAFGINEDELTPDKAKELIKSNKNGDEYKADIDNLTKLLEDKDTFYKSELDGKDNLFKDKLIEIEIAKLSTTLGVAGGKALANFIKEVKEGATLEDGAIVYKDNNGTIERDSTGRPLGVVQKADAVKADEENYYLFKATNGGGGGVKEGDATGTKKFSDYNGAELVALKRTNPTEYDRLKNNQ